MKTTSPLTAILFLGMATAVGAAAWLLSGTTTDDDAASPIQRAATDRSGVGFVAVSPKEQRKQANLDTAKRKLKQIAEVGTEISPGLYMIRDSSGDPTYYSSELIEGRGRNGEPLFMSAEFKKIHTVPLRDGVGMQTKTRLNPKMPKQSLSFGKQAGAGPDSSGGGTSGGADDGGNSGAASGGGGGGDGGSASDGGGATGPRPGDEDG